MKGRFHRVFVNSHAPCEVVGGCTCSTWLFQLLDQAYFPSLTGVFRLLRKGLAFSLTSTSIQAGHISATLLTRPTYPNPSDMYRHLLGARLAHSVPAAGSLPHPIATDPSKRAYQSPDNQACGVQGWTAKHEVARHTAGPVGMDA